MTTRPLTPRIPAPERPWRPRPLLPRLTLLSLLAAILIAGAAGLLTAPPVIDQEQAAAAHYSVRIANFAFAPAAITVNTGDTITWTNEDTAPHTVTTSSGPQALNSPTLSQNQSWSYTFTVAGVYSYYCAVHPDMRAEVVVRAPTATVSTTKAQTRPATVKSSRAAAAPAPSVAAPATTAATSASPSPSSAARSPDESTSAQAAVVDRSSIGGIRGLSPALLLGGLTAAIAVFCLLLVASRAAAREEEE